MKKKTGRGARPWLLSLGMGIGIGASALLSSPAVADILAYEYEDARGETHTASTEVDAINVAGQSRMTFYVQAGLDRYLEVSLLDGQGNLVDSAQSELIGADDRYEYQGTSYYGTTLDLFAPGDDGYYVLRDRILNSAGGVVSEKSHPLTIERDGPTLGEWKIDQARAHEWSGIDRPLIGNRLSGIFLEGIESSVPIDHVLFTLTDDDGNVLRTYEQQVEDGSAGFSREKLFETGTYGAYTITAEVVDVTGNSASSSLDVYYDWSNGESDNPPIEIVGIYDPPRDTGEAIDELGPREGYIPYTPGVTISTNPVGLIFKVPKSNYTDYTPFGLGEYGNSQPHLDLTPIGETEDYVFVGSRNNYSVNKYGPQKVLYRSYDRMINYFGIYADIEMSEEAIVAPELKRWELKFSDMADWTSSMQRMGEPRKDAVLTGARVEVEPRPYPQKVRFRLTYVEQNEYVIIPPGETQAEADFDFNRYAYQSVNPVAYSPAIYFEVYGEEDGQGLYSVKGKHIWMEGDNTPPTVLEVERVDDEMVVRTFEEDRDRLISYLRWRNYYVDFNKSTLKLRNRDTGEWVEVPRSREYQNSHWQRDFYYDLSRVEEGEYDRFEYHVEDRFGNVTERQVSRTLLLDQTAPTISITSDDAIASLDDILIRGQDNLDRQPEMLRASLSGGPADEDVDLALVGVAGGSNVYRLEYPLMFPSLTEGENYTLTITGRDDAGNIGTGTHSFSYAPPQVELAYGDGTTAYLPALSMPFYRPGGSRIIESKVLELHDGSKVVGKYQLVATLRADAEVPLIVNGTHLAPGDSVVINEAYDFSQHESRISVTAYPAEDGLLGTSSLLLSTTAPNAPVLMANITTWVPELSLTSENGWTVHQLVDLVDIRASANSDTTCRVTMDEEIARRADPIADPVCYMAWRETPIETNVVTAGSGEGHISKLYGRAVTLGDQDVSYELYLFSATGERMKVGEGSQTLTVTDATDTIQARLVPELESIPRLIRPVNGVVKEADSSNCTFFSDQDNARAYAETLDIDSPKLACQVAIADLPDGFTARPGTWPGFDGTPTELGEQSIRWEVTAFSRTGVAVVVGNQTHTFQVVEPATPVIDLLTDSSNRRAFKNEEGEDVIPEDELPTIPYGERKLGQVYYKTGPGALDVTVTQGNSTLIEDSYGMPMSSRDRLLMSRVPTDEVYPLWTNLKLRAHAEYTEHPDIQASREFDAIVVPGEKVQPYLYLNADGRKVLNTDTTSFHVEINDPQFEGDYSAERMGTWEVRIVEEVGRDDYTALSDYVTVADDGTADFELQLQAGESANLRLLAEARLQSPIEEFERTEYSGSPIYVTILEGNPLDAEISARKVSGPVPYNGLFQIDFADQEGLRASGDIEWRVRKQGESWQKDPRSVDDRLRLRKEVMFDEAGIYELQATISNRYSGAKSVTQIAEVVVYDVPTLELSGPRTAFVGDSLTLTADVTHNGEPVPTDDLDIEWSIDLGKTWNAAGDANTTTLTLSRDEEESINAWVRVKKRAAPESDRYAWVQDSVGVSFRDHKPISAYIVGPRQVETGVEYEFSVNVREPYIGFNRELVGFFTLPDGTRVEGQSFTYTPTDADMENGTLDVLYTGWVDGYRDTSEATDTYYARVWKYIWPIWGMYIKSNANVAPADVLLRIRQVTRSNRLEDLTYEWELDPSLQVTQAYSDVMRQMIAPDPGDYHYRIVIRDGRGNETVLEDDLTYGEPEPFLVEQRQYFSNRYMRAPLEVSVSPMVSGGHPRDRVSHFEFEVDGERMNASSRYLRTPLAEGRHDITVRMVSDYGEVVEQTETVQVEANQPPICDIRSYDTSTAWRFRSDCRDPDGRVVDYEWTVNGEVIDMESYGLSISKGQYPARPAVKLRGLDDSGDYSNYVTN